MRASGSTATYDAWLGSGDLTISAVTPTVVSLTADTQTPIAPGTTVTWKAVAAGGTTPLEYEFWLYRPTGGWAIIQGLQRHVVLDVATRTAAPTRSPSRAGR